MLKQIKLNKIKEFFKKLPMISGKHAFFTFLVFLLLALILGGFVFYKYSILIEKLEPQLLEKPIQFNEKIYQKILKIWEEREKVFKETETKTYSNPFQE